MEIAHYQREHDFQLKKRIPIMYYSLYTKIHIYLCISYAYVYLHITVYYTQTQSSTPNTDILEITLLCEVTLELSVKWKLFILMNQGIQLY